MSYNLERVCREKSAVYRQVLQYYSFCENVRQMSPVTMISKTHAINSFIRESGISDLRKINNQAIYNWIGSQLGRGNTGRSINDRLAHLKAMLRWQKDMNLSMPKLKLSLITKVNEAPPRKVCFSRQEIHIVLKYANDLEWLLIKLCFDCGLRLSELRNLKRSDLQEDKLLINGKGQKMRYVFLSPETKLRLEKWLNLHPKTEFFWASPLNPDRPLASCTLRLYLKQCFARAGISDFRPHDLRHSYATDLKHLGISTRQIQAALGHATEAVTERYLNDLEGFDLRSVYEIKYSR